MSEVKHTPGPWDLYADVPSVDPNWHIVTNEGRTRVLANVHIEPDNAMDAANARLIAAAPDLLAICEEIANARVDLLDSERRIRLYNAINKAGGSL